MYLAIVYDYEICFNEFETIEEVEDFVERYLSFNKHAVIDICEVIRRVE